MNLFEIRTLQATYKDVIFYEDNTFSHKKNVMLIRRHPKLADTIEKSIKMIEQEIKMTKHIYKD